MTSSNTSIAIKSNILISNSIKEITIYGKIIYQSSSRYTFVWNDVEGVKNYAGSGGTNRCEVYAGCAGR